MLQSVINKINGMRIILASSSKPRANLLRSTGLKFEIVSSNYEENLNPVEYSYSEYVEKTALGKLLNVYEKVKNDDKKPDIIIASDTMVAFNGNMFGKPKTKEEAIKYISQLTQSNIPHQIYTGVLIWYKNEIHKFTEVTTVHMASLSDEEVLAYVDTGEPMGKAGGYGLQGIASTFIKRIEGDFNNVIGLPLCSLSMKLKEIILQ